MRKEEMMEDKSQWCKRVLKMVAIVGKSKKLERHEEDY